MDVSKSRMGTSNENSECDGGKKRYGKKKRSAKQMERTRKWRERHMCEKYYSDTVTCNAEVPAAVNHTLDGCASYVGSVGNRFVQENLWEKSKDETINKEPVSNLRATAKVFVPTAAQKLEMPFTQGESAEKSTVGAIIKETVSTLRATAEIFVPAAAQKIDKAEYNETAENDLASEENAILENKKEKKELSEDNENPKCNETLEEPIINDSVTSEDNIIAVDEDNIILEEDRNTQEDEIILEDIATHENNNTTENILDDDTNGMFAILEIFANSSLHCMLDMTTKPDSKSKENEEFGYAYFSLSNLLK